MLTFEHTWLLLKLAVHNGFGGYDQIHKSGESGRVSTPDRSPAGHRNVFHGVVLRLRGDLYKVHTGRVQGAAHLPGGLPVHGLRCAVPAPLGGHIRLTVKDTRSKTKVNIPVGQKSRTTSPWHHRPSPWKLGL
ncbi:hypothetical protein COCON_G00110660 [Conger conger]|uniref:Secreted protein n=1 Tax=Conger conger TaxID=82655 RepID=A0A9Q1DJQ0_CONCO|nr:hypothetical protein COCON_G00110660 [Conger conger]